VFAPTGTPPAVVQKLNEAINRAIQSADVKNQLALQAFDVVGGTPQYFSDYVKTEVVKWAKVVKETGAKPD
jgi:tripartite-type tricarboxylate transporter receptor subunit TctC